MTDTFTVNTRYGSYSDCFLSKGTYYNGHVAYEVMCSDGPFARLTVNIDGIEEFPKNFSCVDTNNFPEAERVIAMLGIAKPTGIVLPSGWCTYPIYEFTEE